MDSAERSPDSPAREEQPDPNPDDSLGLVPGQGKHAARPSEAERREVLHQYPQTDEEALRQEGIELTPELYRDLPEDPGTERPSR